MYCQSERAHKRATKRQAYLGMAAERGAVGSGRSPVESPSPQETIVGAARAAGSNTSTPMGWELTGAGGEETKGARMRKNMLSKNPF